MVYIYLPQIRGLLHIVVQSCSRESVAGYHICDNLPPDILEHLCNNKLIIPGAKAFQYAIAMGVDVDSMNLSDNVEFVVTQTSDLAETMVKRMWEGIPLT